MKLRMNPYSYNGQPLERDEFAWGLKPGNGFNVEGVDEIIFPCPHKVGGICVQKVTLGPPLAGQNGGANRWHWNGSMEAPTLSPSIGCDNSPRRCGWHGHIIDGETKP